jgi:predicted MFS family arabinose efflux permease
LFSQPLGLKYPILGILPFFLWGAMGWASQAPQQHVLLHLQPNHGAATVALNSSANYLGSAIGSALGGIVMLAGLAPSQLPFAAGCLVLVTLLGQLLIVLRKSKEQQGIAN